MTLGIFIVSLFAAAGLTYFCMAFAADRPRSIGTADDAERLMISVMIVVAFAVALAARPIQFGVDTITYLGYYDQYCFSRIDDLELSYTVTFTLLDIFQLGSCSSDALTTTWILLIVISFLALPDLLSTRIKLAAISIMSLIGIELATNALRQGLSASVMMLGLAWFRRNKTVGIIFIALAVLLHASTGLVLIAVIAAYLRFRYFAVAFAALIVLVLSYSYLGLNVEVLNRLTGEINKYAAHDADDLYVRILSAAQLFAPIMAAIVTKGWAERRSVEETNDLAIALKIAVTALPYLMLPYFGYRYVYGIYPVVLYLSRGAVLDDRRPVFEIVLITNGVIALVWALGSSYISQIPFVVL